MKKWFLSVAKSPDAFDIDNINSVLHRVDTTVPSSAVEENQDIIKQEQEASDIEPDKD